MRHTSLLLVAALLAGGLFIGSAQAQEPGRRASERPLQRLQERRQDRVNGEARPLDAPRETPRSGQGEDLDLRRLRLEVQRLRLRVALAERRLQGETRGPVGERRRGELRARVIQRFDRNGDQRLDASERESARTEVRARLEQRRRGQRGGAERAPEQGGPERMPRRGRRGAGGR